MEPVKRWSVHSTLASDEFHRKPVAVSAYQKYQFSGQLMLANAGYDWIALEPFGSEARNNSL